MKIIAEIGVNHNGDLQTALQLVDAAKGADAVKIQMFDPERLDPPGERRDMLTKLILPQPGKVRDRVKELGMEFWITPFDPWMLERARRLEPDMIKIASGSLSDTQLLNEISEPCVLSTGMATIDEVKQAVTELSQDPVCIMHCVSSYPCPVDKANLSRIADLQSVFGGIGIGYSDHTTSRVLPVAALALGATMLEKHLTLDVMLDGPDHLSSITPHEFDDMVRHIRYTEAALNDPGYVDEEACKAVKREREEWRRGYSELAVTQGH